MRYILNQSDTIPTQLLRIKIFQTINISIIYTLVPIYYYNLFYMFKKHHQFDTGIYFYMYLINSFNVLRL